MIMSSSYRVLSFAGLVVSFAGAARAQVGVDGSIGAEWSGPGVTVRTVSYNADAATSNFGSPGTTNHLVAYTTYFRADNAFVYAAVAANPIPENAGSFPQFANLYFSTVAPSNGSIAMEVTNNRFFRGGVNTGGPNNDGFYSATGYSTWVSNSLAGVIEVAIPISFFTADPLGMGFAVATTQVRWNLSQSFGYSVAGGASYNQPNGPDERLGLVDVPAPAPLAALGICGAWWSRRRRTGAA
ncbi:MAG: hypothetical protein U0570_06680 [Phycisphaerales bacterium]